MATYVCSDMHGHLAAFDRALSRISLAEDDTLYVIGDMVDRGPDPVGVLKLVKSLPNAIALLGNHEDMMLTSLADPSDAYQWLLWSQNGGMVTAEGLTHLTAEGYADIVRWVKGLPLYDVVDVGGRSYVLVHAGFMPVQAPEEGWDEAGVRAMLAAQDPEDLLWVRDEFFGQNTGLLREDGTGFITISGHTPTVVVEGKANILDRPARDERGMLQMLYLGACSQTGGIPDRLAIDCGAGSVKDYGQVCVLRLDDLEEFYEPVLDGE